MLFTHRPSRLIILFLHFCLVSCLSGTPIYWPTANPAFQKNLGIENYIQATASGKIVSGLFGCVRNDGHKFHEGLDLKATTYGKNKESIDPVFSVMKGIVAYVNIRDKKSSYGRYVIIEHTDESPSIFSLYAHLKSVNSKIKTGASVKSGQVIGIMGRSSSVYDIPKNQTHLHFELGLRLSDNFQSWYDQRKFKSKNDHNIWNGMNLVGFDPLEYYKSHRTGKINSIHEYLSQLKPACTIKIISNKTPDFIHRYPSLSTEKFDKKGTCKKTQDQKEK